MRTLRTDNIAWLRLNGPYHYVGSLTASGRQVRLVGRDSFTGIEVALSIPFGEIEEVHTSSSPDELLTGERCIVLELADSKAICLREAGAEPGRTAWLAGRLNTLITNGRPAGSAAATGSGRRER